MSWKLLFSKPLSAASIILCYAELAMVKSYLRYEQAVAFGVIVSVDSNITYGSSGKHLLAPALEKVGVWHVRQGVCTRTLIPAAASRGHSLSVTSIASSHTSLVSFLTELLCVSWLK